MGGDHWRRRRNWCTERPIWEWDGVDVDQNGRVVKLFLHSNNLRGQLPEVIGTLAKLKVLHLFDNKLVGSIPDSIVHLSDLTYLNLARNQHSGSIPHSIGNLSALTYLDLAGNRLCGSIPDSIGDLSALTELYLVGNDLSGSIPVSISNLSALWRLDLARNQVTGELQAASFPALIRLDLADNKLSRIDPRLFARRLTPHLMLLFWRGNPLRQPPEELLPRNWDGSDLDRLRAYASQVLSTYREMKLAIVGKENVGKTVLTHRLLRQDAQARQHLQTRQPTTGVHHEQWQNPLQLPQDDDLARLRLRVWDYAGQQAYRGTHQCFFTRQAIYLLVFDLSDDGDISARFIKQWICDIQDRAPGAVFVVVGTKADLLELEDACMKYQHVLDEAQSYAASIQIDRFSRHGDIRTPLILPGGGQDHFHSCCIVSCTHAESVDRLRGFIIRNAIGGNTQRFPHLFEERPASILEAIFYLGKSSRALGVPMQDIQHRANVSYDQLHTGLQFWNGVGMCLWNPDSDVVFHDPQQISEILKVLIEPQNIVDVLSRTESADHGTVAWEKLNSGEITREIVKLLWADQAANNDRFPELVLSLFEHLDLVFEVSSGTYRVPLVLQPYKEPLTEIIRRLHMTDKERIHRVTRKPVYVLRVTFPARPDIPYGLFERLLARIYKAKDSMLDDCDIAHESENKAWFLSRDCLTDGSWFAIFVSRSRQLEAEITLRIDCREDGSLRFESRCFAKRVWDEFRELASSYFSGVRMKAFIVLEDWKRETELQQQDLEFRLDDILLDNNGFVRDPSQRIPVLNSSTTNHQLALQLWAESLDRSNLPMLEPLGQNPNFKKLKISKVIGKSRCHVYKGFYDGYPIAAKEFDLKHEQRNDARNKFEFETQKELKFHKILHAFGFCEDNDGMFGYLILEYAKYGSLFNVCHRKPVHRHTKSDLGLDIKLPMRVRWLQHVIGAVCFLHWCNMMHRDIKCENVMLHADMTALLGDLGWAKELSQSCTRTANAGTSCFRAPEVGSDTERVSYSKPADIYSYGMTIVELLTGECPTKGCTQLEELAADGTDEYMSHLQVLCCIAKVCTTKDPLKRPTAATVREWFNVVLLSLQPDHQLDMEDDQQPLRLLQRDLYQQLSAQRADGEAEHKSPGDVMRSHDGTNRGRAPIQSHEDDYDENGSTSSWARRVIRPGIH